MINWFRGKLSKKKPESGNPLMGLSNEQIKGMLEMIRQTGDEELSCEDVFELIDQYAELVSSGGDVSALMPLVDMHLKICPDCKEEFDTLLDLLLAEET